ncbi:MAG TPA: NADP-dependent isocitrate dehydrogenase [Acidimicrobiia bacterium]|jgi:isocitrate dehydrogenase|nr:NADP-dependent isocitrate dehydrogenase [Acidimicrobiia bacterium]HIL06606.1 NADP-dependent isocitrate dehydrogenase [Acidimicrobiia bacterium]
MSKIIYTHTDEAPALATYSFLPIIQAFARAAGVAIETRDISLAGRMIASFPELLDEEQRLDDALAEMGAMTHSADANIIKLPNISASLPQLQATIVELQAAGYRVPDYPADPSTSEEEETRRRYDRIQGSAVNPVLREGNSDRRAPRAVKDFARKFPHPMGVWSPDSATHVATMDEHDFRSNELSTTIQSDSTLRIEHQSEAGQLTVLKEVAVIAGEIVDATFMSAKHLRTFLDEQIRDSKQQNVLFSLHLKATMMKVSDPIIFGHGVRAYFADVFTNHGDVFESIGVNVNNGLGDLLEAIQELPAEDRENIEADIAAAYESGPALAMVDSDKGITNLHVPSDVIVDASMPAMLRTSGQMWNSAGSPQDTKAVIPDSSYAGIYQAVIEDCIEHGAYDPTTMGSVPNVGLMAQKAEEYGSHDKTFELAETGTIRVIQADDTVLLEHHVEAGDIWRMCSVKDEPIRDWVKLAVARGHATGAPVVFWLDGDRAHDAQLIRKVEQYLGEHETDGLEIKILSPVDATRLSLQRIRRGEDTISVTGNVLRDYNTDLFPILEVGTSAKMLSIVPLMNGGGLFETGAGGSAPKHVQQFEAENHLRWDSLGEFLALAVSFEHLGSSTNNPTASLLGSALDQATSRLLDEGKSPSRKVGELDNRGSHFYIALWWAEAMANQDEDSELASLFVPLAVALAKAEATIVQDLIDCQGVPMDIGGYYFPDSVMASKAMRPSEAFNSIIDQFAS